MVDFVDIEAPFSYEIPSESYEPFYWKELCFTPKFKKGFLNGFESEFKGLKIRIKYGLQILCINSTRGITILILLFLNLLTVSI